MKKNAKKFFIYVIVALCNCVFGAQEKLDKKRKQEPTGGPVDVRKHKKNKGKPELACDIKVFHLVHKPSLLPQLCLRRCHYFATDQEDLQKHKLKRTHNHPYMYMQGGFNKRSLSPILKKELEDKSPVMRRGQQSNLKFPKFSGDSPSSAQSESEAIKIFATKLRACLASKEYDDVRPLADCFLSAPAYIQEKDMQSWMRAAKECSLDDQSSSMQGCSSFSSSSSSSCSSSSAMCGSRICSSSSTSINTAPSAPAPLVASSQVLLSSPALPVDHQRKKNVDVLINQIINQAIQNSDEPADTTDLALQAQATSSDAYSSLPLLQIPDDGDVVMVPEMQRPRSPVAVLPLFAGGQPDQRVATELPASFQDADQQPCAIASADRAPEPESNESVTPDDLNALLATILAHQAQLKR